MISVALVTTFGSVSLLGGAYVFFFLAYTLWTDNALLPASSEFWRMGLVMGLWCIGCGGSLVAAARLWWKGRWRLALAIVGVCTVGAQLLRVTGLMPN